MSTFAGLDGCWYLTRQGTTGVVQESDEADQPFDAGGNDTSEGATAQPGDFDVAGNPR
jgi:hypothetical protein